MSAFSKLPLAAKLAGVLLFACVAAGLGSLRDAPGGESMEDWQIEDLVVCLCQNGLEFRTVPTRPNGLLNQGAFLTTTDKPFQELDGLGVFPEHIERWQDVVRCYRVCRRFPELKVWTEVWDEGCYSRVGPFILFGDAELRARIWDALRDAGVSLK
jgi:hypothetical protein